MNKLFIVLLAVCLVSVNSAVVKREAETSTTNYFDKMKLDVEEFTRNMNKQLAEAFNPEQIKKTLNEGIDNFNKAVNDLTKQGGAKQ